MTEILVWVLAAFASTRWATLITRDTFGPIRRIREWIEYRYPDPDTEFRGDHIVMVADSDPIQLVNQAGVELVPVEFDGERVSVAVALNPHPLGTLVTCVRCMSVWTGLVAAVIVLTAPTSVVVAVFAPFAFSQFAIWITHAD